MVMGQEGKTNPSLKEVIENSLFHREVANARMESSGHFLSLNSLPLFMVHLFDELEERRIVAIYKVRLRKKFCKCVSNVSRWWVKKWSV